MRATPITVLAVASMSSVHAQLYNCDTLAFPDFDSCDRVMAEIPWDDGPEGQFGSIPDGMCQYFSELSNVGNCIIQACNQRGDGQADPLNVFSGRAYYSLVKEWCKPQRAGGQAPGEGPLIVNVVNNPDYNPPSAAKRAAIGELSSTLMTFAEAKAFEERAKQINKEKLTGDDFDKRAASPSNQLQKRAEWHLAGTIKNVRKNDERSRLSAVAGSGSQQQWSTTEGYSTSVTTSAEMGVDLFEVFTASVSISVTQEFSVSYTETVVFDPSGRCDQAQEAVLYFYPLFDQYMGWFDDSDVDYTVYIPVEGPNNYAIDVECLG